MATPDIPLANPSEESLAAQEGATPDAMRWARFSFSTPQGESLSPTAEIAIPYQPECTWKPNDLQAQLVLSVDEQGEVVHLSFDDSSLMPALQPAVRAALFRTRFPPEPGNPQRRLRASIQFASHDEEPLTLACPP